MCVLICRIGQQPLLAANRDEAYARPFSAPRRWVAGTPFWAPRDEEEGGTWIGVNRNGLVAALANRSRLAERKGLSSRGHLVTGALARPDLESASAWVRSELARAPRNPCQLLLVQGAVGRLLLIGPERVGSDEIAPGLHVLSNLHDPDEIDFGLAADAGWHEIRPILADPRPHLPRGLAVCKRADWRGTVASALIEPGRRFLFAPGPPDEVAYEPVAYP
ncbi:MAG: NRDE family protein [Planctomycetota bacterium]|jgi:hypothetical protein